MILAILAPKNTQILEISKNVKYKPLLTFDFKGSLFFNFFDLALYFSANSIFSKISTRGWFLEATVVFPWYLLNHSSYRPQPPSKNLQMALLNKSCNGDDIVTFTVLELEAQM